MRVTVHFRGRPLLALDITAQSPDDDVDEATGETPKIQAAGPVLADTDRAQAYEQAEYLPDEITMGFGR